MTSEPKEAYVWVWLPEATSPVVAGRLDVAGDATTFTYGRTYRDNEAAVPLFLPELPLREGAQMPLDGMRVAGVLADAGPDSWGQKVVMRKHLGRADGDHDQISPLTYFLESGSDRTGALDFQTSSDDYEPRDATAPLDDLLDAARRLDEDLPVDPAVELALLHGSSLG